MNTVSDVPVYPTPYKTKALLTHLLTGQEVDTIFAITEFNLATVNSRASELRRLGWPVRSDKKPHPRLPREYITVYRLDAHFRHWFFVENDAKVHPSNYRDDDARKSFATKSLGNSDGYRKVSYVVRKPDRKPRKGAPANPG